MSSFDRHEYLKSMLYGFDIDPFGLEIARSCLMLADFPNPNGWHLSPVDVLDSTASGKFRRALCDARESCSCNPPFGEFKPEQRENLKLSSVYKQVELFHSVMSNTPHDAMLGFVMPIQFLTGAFSFSRLQEKCWRKDTMRSNLFRFPTAYLPLRSSETALIIAKSPRVPNTRSVDILHRKVIERTGWKEFNQFQTVSREDFDQRQIDECGDSFAIPVPE